MQASSPTLIALARMAGSYSGLFQRRGNNPTERRPRGSSCRCKEVTRCLLNRVHTG